MCCADVLLSRDWVRLRLAASVNATYRGRIHGPCTLRVDNAMTLIRCDIEQARGELHDVLSMPILGYARL